MRPCVQSLTPTTKEKDYKNKLTNSLPVFEAFLYRLYLLRFHLEIYLGFLLDLLSICTIDNCIYLWCTMWWFNICTHHEMIATIKLINIFITLHSVPGETCLPINSFCDGVIVEWSSWQELCMTWRLSLQNWPCCASNCR